MYITKSKQGFSFFLGIRDETVSLSLWLGDDGGEELRVNFQTSNKRLPSLKLSPGSIKQLLGKSRWENFIRLREAGHGKIYLPPTNASA